MIITQNHTKPYTNFTVYLFLIGLEASGSWKSSPFGFKWYFWLLLKLQNDKWPGRQETTSRGFAPISPMDCKYFMRFTVCPFIRNPFDIYELGFSTEPRRRWLFRSCCPVSGNLEMGCLHLGVPEGFMIYIIFTIYRFSFSFSLKMCFNFEVL